MNALVIGINYNDAGERTIEKLYYNASANTDRVEQTLDRMEKTCDEVFVSDSFDPNNKEFISYIVSNFCKYSV